MNTNTRSEAATQRDGKYLTFTLGNEDYGLEILKVREIIGCMEITAVPRTPAYVSGVINLRGQVISVVDLRAKLGMEQVARDEQTCIIVIEVEHDGRKVNTGIIVDHVSEVLNIPAANIEDAPDFGRGVETEFILGIAKVANTVKILLDINKILSRHDVIAVAAAASGIDSAATAIGPA